MLTLLPPTPQLRRKPSKRTQTAHLPVALQLHMNRPRGNARYCNICWRRDFGEQLSQRGGISRARPPRCVSITSTLELQLVSVAHRGSFSATSTPLLPSPPLPLLPHPPSSSASCSNTNRAVMGHFERAGASPLTCAAALRARRPPAGAMLAGKEGETPGCSDMRRLEVVVDTLIWC